VDSLVHALPPDGADPVFADFFSLLHRIRGQLLSHPVRFDAAPRHPAGWYPVLPILLFPSRVSSFRRVYSSLPLFVSPEFFVLIPAVLLSFRRIVELLSNRHARITLSDGTFDPERWRFYLATLRLLASIAEPAMVIPYHPVVVQHYEAIIAQAAETLRTFLSSFFRTDHPFTCH
jgi:hypothetical protein